MNEKKLVKAVVSFVRKPAKMGKAFLFSIPKDYIEGGMIDPNKKYRIYLEELEDGEENEESKIDED